MEEKIEVETSEEVKSETPKPEVEEEGSEDLSKEDITSQEVQGTPPATEETPEQKRINDLMSMWQKADARADKLEQQIKGQEPSQQEEPSYRKEGWEPQDYGELRKAIITAEERGEKKALEVLEQREQKQQQAKEQIDNFVAETKGTDKEFNETDFFKYTQEHSFKVNTIDELKSVYSAYKEVRNARIQGEQNAAKNIQKRKQDVVSGPKSGEGTPYSVPSDKIRGSGSAYDAVMDAYHKIKK